MGKWKVENAVIDFYLYKLYFLFSIDGWVKGQVQVSRYESVFGGILFVPRLFTSAWSAEFPVRQHVAGP